MVVGGQAIGCFSFHACCDSDAKNAKKIWKIWIWWIFLEICGLRYDQKPIYSWPDSDRSECTIETRPHLAGSRSMCRCQRSNLATLSPRIRYPCSRILADIYAALCSAFCCPYIRWLVRVCDRFSVAVIPISDVYFSTWHSQIIWLPGHSVLCVVYNI